jgi:hypothetical protein
LNDLIFQYKNRLHLDKKQAKPICKTLPKFHLVRKEKEKKQYSVDVYEYNKKNRNLEFKKSLYIEGTLY